MEVEGASDFRALRAKFQNDSCFSNALTQASKKPPEESLYLPSTSMMGLSSPRLLNQGKVLVSEQKREQYGFAVPGSELMQSKPLLFPRVKQVNLYLAGKNENPKTEVLEGSLCADASPRGDSQTPRPNSYICQQAAVNTNSEEALLKNSFHHTRQIWESASAQNDRKGAVFPPLQGMCGNSSAHSQVLNATIAAKNNKIKSAGKEQIPSFSTQKNSPLPSRTPVLPQTSLLLVSREDKRNEQSTKVTGFSQFAYDPHKPSEISQYLKASKPFLLRAGTGSQPDVKNSKPPKIKPLPSVESLGSPPKKPPRPPKVNLSAFRQSEPLVSGRNETAAVDDYMTPENAKSEELHNYEETISYMTQSGNASCAIRDIAYLPSMGTQEDDKISDSEGTLYKSQINEDHGRGKSKLQIKQGERTDVIHTEEWLAEHGVEYSGYVCVGDLKADEDMVASNQRILKPMQTSEDVYDDVEGIESAASQAYDVFSSFTSDSFSEDNSGEIYEDIHNGDYNPVKLDLDGIERLKKLGQFFKKDKIKPKNTKMKENIRILSSSVPNLDVSQENKSYDDIDVDQKDAKEKDDKYKNWKLKFLMPKDKDSTRSSEDIESLSTRNFFKVKKYNIDKRKNMTKEEKFRETFMYNKEITVVNTAIANCSNLTSKGKLDLPITAGEQLDVIDVTEENKIICRNSKGKYGYVLLEHLNFRH